MHRELMYLMGFVLVLGLATGAAVADPNVVGQWKFDGPSGTTVIDSSSNNNHGTIYGGASLDGSGQLTLDGIDDYVDLPIGSVVASLTNCTFAVWVDFSNEGGAWQRVFDFGNDTTVNMFLTPRTGTTGPMRFAITTGGEQQVTAPDTLPSGLHCVVVRIDADSDTITLFLDGSPVASNTSTTLTPSDLGNTINNRLGRSQYSADAYFKGSYDEFRIYDYALSNTQIEQLCCIPTEIATNPNPPDGIIDVPIDADLSWTPGDYVQDVNGHDVYFGTDETAVTNATKASHPNVDYYNVDDPCCDPGVLQLDQVYYWRVDEVNEPDIWKGNVWSFTTQTAKATDPVPADGAKHVDPNVILTWRPGPKAASHDVYFGTNETAVTNATRASHPNVDYYNIEDPYCAPGPLELDITYYWRVDEVNEPDIWKGNIWSFMVSEAGGVFEDGFNTPHNYVTEGAAGTGWDGFLGLGPGETVDSLNADINRPGQLYLASVNGRYQEPWDPLGPFLYKIVEGDFVASVKVTDYQDVLHNNGGIMARVGNLDTAGPGEDWASIDYFPIWGCGNYARYADDGVRTELCHNGKQWDLDPYLQLERSGSLIYFRCSPDGINWDDLACSPIIRNDLVGVPLQVGLFQATYSVDSGYMAFDDFSLEVTPPNLYANRPNPEDEAVDMPADVILTWIPGYQAASHDIYFGTDLNDVNDADNSWPVGSSVYKGNQGFSNFSYDPGILEPGRTYYWRIDEVNDAVTWTGQVWSFTTFDYDIDDFESYANTSELGSSWVPDGSASVSLSTSQSHGGSKSMQVNYSNSSAPYYSQATLTLDSSMRDWAAYGAKALVIYFRGDANNGAEQMYAVFENGTWSAERAMIKYSGDANNLKKSYWQRWDIDLDKLIDNNPAFRLLNVAKITIGFGDVDNNSAGGSGTVYIDDILLWPTRCIAENQPDLDFNNDCTVDWEDLKILADGWLNGSTVEADPYSDKQVDWKDYALLVGGWLSDYEIWPTDALGTPLGAVPYSDVDITGGFWAPRLETHHTVTVPHCFQQCEDTGRIDNFRKAAGVMSGSHVGASFDDSDVYKVVEGAAYSLRNHPDPNLEAYVDSLIELFEAAQWEDGYLFTFYSIPHQPGARWTNIGALHELYCAGHFFEAAVAYYQTTGKTKILDVATGFADHIDTVFGPGKNMYPPGHQEVELALVKLYHQTGEQRYFDLAKFFIDQRGNAEGHNPYGTYSQDHIPVIEQDKAVGHGVRAQYMYSGMCDIVMVNQDANYASALNHIWDNVVSCKQYITGGIGQPGGPEGFAADYSLGNWSYCETCAAIANVFWNHRLLLLHHDGKYGDVLERALYSGALAGVSLSGDLFFYTNPLQSEGSTRLPWHGCACCPSNIARFIPSVAQYIYAKAPGALYINLFTESSGTVDIGDTTVNIIQSTDYPWDGDVTITVNPSGQSEFDIYVRIPGWTQNRPMPSNLYDYLNEKSEQVTLEVNGQPVVIELEKGFARIQRTWQQGDIIQLHLPMPARRVIAHPVVDADVGLVTIERGPIVYCAEWPDNGGNISGVYIPDDLQLSAAYNAGLLGGVVVISGQNPDVVLIPYYAWANRGGGQMAVWLPRNP